MIWFGQKRSIPAIMDDVPTVPGTRIAVEMILRWRRDGCSRGEIACDYPNLPLELRRLWSGPNARTT